MLHVLCNDFSWHSFFWTLYCVSTVGNFWCHRSSMIQPGTSLHIISFRQKYFFCRNHPIVLYNNKAIYSVKTQHILVINTINLASLYCWLLIYVVFWLNKLLYHLGKNSVTLLFRVHSDKRLKYSWCLLQIMFPVSSYWDNICMNFNEYFIILRMDILFCDIWYFTMLCTEMSQLREN